MQDDDEDDVTYACDDCGDEFASRASLEGHEAEGCWAAPATTEGGALTD